MKTYYCTVEAAKRAGINRTTLERWQREKRFTPSVLIHTGGKHLYSGWSLEDIELVEAFKGTLKPGSLVNVPKKLRAVQK